MEWGRKLSIQKSVYKGKLKTVGGKVEMKELSCVKVQRHYFCNVGGPVYGVVVLTSATCHALDRVSGHLGRDCRLLSRRGITRSEAQLNERSQRWWNTGR